MSDKKLTNKERVLDYLRFKGMATIRDLNNELFIQTSQEYIRQLKNEGHFIETVYFPNEKHCHYILHAEEQMEIKKCN